MRIEVLTVEDNPELRGQIIEYFHGSKIDDYELSLDEAENFDIGIDKIKNNDYDVIILDLCKGVPSEDNNDRPGLEALEEIRRNTFSPVIFFSGIAHTLTEISSPIVSVVNKAAGIEELEKELAQVINSKLGILKKNIYSHVKDSLKVFFWEAVHEKKEVFGNVSEETSLGYLMLRRLSNSLSKNNIKSLIGDDNIDLHKAHPMEFYIYPINSAEYEVGEILEDNKDFFVILTPSCDFVKTGKRGRRVGNVLLVKAIPLVETSEYDKFSKNQSKYEQSLANLVASRKGDQYFFLPKTPFLKQHLVIDFQNKIMVTYKDLENFKRVAKLDSPFSESMVASFIRFYNRVGHPDIDVDFILKDITNSIKK